LQFNFDLSEEYSCKEKIHKKYQINRDEYQLEIHSTK
jgi:hypothetical protein